MNTPYHTAFTFHAMAASGNCKGLKMMFEEVGSDQAASIVNARDHRGFTVLHKAIESGKDELVKVLIKLGADISAEVTGSDPEGWTALHFAAFDNHPHIINLLASHGAELEHRDKSITQMTPLRVAVTRNNTECVRVLLALCADPFETNPQGFTLLHEASNIGSHNIVSLLVEAGCDPSAKANDGSTPVMWATQHEDHDLMAILNHSN